MPHSKLGGSGAYRWLMCPGSPRMCEGVEDEGSKYALEGTAAHALAYECLTERRSPFSYINGGTITVEDEDTGDQIEYEVTADMANAVMTYMHAVRAVTNRTGATPGYETAFNMAWLDPELWGMNDYRSFVPFDTLYVYDYKHGAGVVVEVEYPEPVTYFAGGSSKYNPQLMYYAAGALGPTNELNLSDVELGIVQPRARHYEGPVRVAKLSIDTLLRWRDEVLVPGVAATREPDAPCVSGKWCQFCAAIAQCPAAAENIRTVTRMGAAEAFADKTAFPTVDQMTDHQKAKLFEFSGLLNKWVEKTRAAIKKDVLGGTKVKDLKVVLGNRNREWANPVAAQAMATLLVGDDATQPRKFKTVLQIENALSDNGMDREAMAGQVRTTRPPTVVHESDKRSAVAIDNAAEAFNVAAT